MIGGREGKGVQGKRKAGAVEEAGRGRDCDVGYRPRESYSEGGIDGTRMVFQGTVDEQNKNL